MPSILMPRSWWGRVVWAVTFEWLLTTKAKRANGGGVIFARSLLSACLAWVVLVGLREILAPTGFVWEYSVDRFRALLLDTASLFGAVFLGAFASFYARFASQWSYVASMYNQIKGAEVRGVTTAKGKAALAQWKAGFIEDADDLHLATKPGIASTIVAWSTDSAVGRDFVAHCGSKSRFDAIVGAASRAAPGHEDA